MIDIMRLSAPRLCIVSLCLLAASPAFARIGDGVAGGFLGGFAHPIFGPDHVVAMVAPTIAIQLIALVLVFIPQRAAA